jgi:hypothetical protein
MEHTMGSDGVCVRWDCGVLSQAFYHIYVEAFGRDLASVDVKMFNIVQK